MPSIPIFIVTAIKKAKRLANKNAYTASHSMEPMYQVKMLSGFFFGDGITFSYPDQNKAEVFSPYQIYNPSQIIEQAAPRGEPFTVQDIYKTQGFGKKNLYTDEPERYDQWNVALEGPSGTYIDMWYPYAPPGFAIGHPYTVQDLFGTLRAPAFDNSEQLQAAVGGAWQQASQTGPRHQTPAQVVTLNQAASAASQASAFGTDTATATAVGNAVLNQTAATFFLSIASGAQQLNWWITDGGASGWYTTDSAQQIINLAFPGDTGSWTGFNAPTQQGIFTATGSNTTESPATLAQAGFVHYATGTFNSPANGLFVGDYETDAIGSLIQSSGFLSGGG